MALFTTVKKEEEKNDAKTLPATEFVERLVKMRREDREQKSIPNTEKLKEK